MSVITNGDKKKIFFYANEDAEYYDLLEEFTQPCIDLIHDTMVDLVVYSLTWKLRKAVESPFYVLDVASGTGAEAFRLLRQINEIQIVAVDFSPPMNQQFRRKFAEQYPDRDFQSVITLIEDDFFGEACAPENLLTRLPKDSNQQCFDAIIAGFFLHHYPAKIKQEFFKRTYELLRPTGALVLCEAISFESQRLSDFAHDFGERWMQKQFSNPDERLQSKYNALGSEAVRLYRQWIDHWQNTHIYAPDVTIVGGQQVGDVEIDTSYASMALKAGFKEIGFPFRLWEAGILWALK